MNRIFTSRRRFVLALVGTVCTVGAGVYLWTDFGGLESFKVSMIIIILGLLIMVLQHLIDSAETLEQVWLSDKTVRDRMNADLQMKATMLVARTAELAAILARESSDRSHVVDQKFAELSEKLDDNTRVTNETAAALKDGKR